MTNAEFAGVLEKLALKYRENDELKQISMLVGTYEKRELSTIIKTLGGRWKKRGMNDTSEYASLYFDSVEFKPLTIYIPRNSVCRRIVHFECEPIMSPEEEAEILQEAV
jgi:hypothetical protein